jgi:predicted lipid-binding transport protein (Tim44 family)
MSQMRYTLQSRPKSLLGQVLGFVFGIAILAVSFVVGAFFLAAILGIVLILAVFIAVRMWWLRRQFASSTENEFVDAEYRVVERRERK